MNDLKKKKNIVISSFIKIVREKILNFYIVYILILL